MTPEQSCGFPAGLSGGVILLTDESGRIVGANDEAVSVYGYSREDLLQMAIRELCDPSRLASFPKCLSRPEVCGPLVFETVHQDRGHKSLPVEVSVRSIAVGGKRLRQCTVRDISEKEDLGEKLRSALDTPNAVIDASPAAIVTLTLDARVSTWNKAAERIFGWTAPEVIGRPIPTVPTDCLEQFARVQERLKAGEAIDSLQVRAQRKDGAQITTGLSAAPLRDDEGNITGSVAILFDISEQVRAERLLRESELRFRATFEQVAVGMCHTTDDGRFLRANQRFCEMTGYSEEELRRMTFTDITHPDDVPGSGRSGPFVFGEMDGATIEKRYIRKDGTTSWGQLTASVLRDSLGNAIHRASGQPCVRASGASFPADVPVAPIASDHEAATVVFFRDITDDRLAQEERAQLEQELLQAQKMESVGRLAGGVAHDFNNHLTVINGYCAMLLREFGTQEIQGEWLQEIAAAGQRAAVLTQQLLTFSRKQLVELKAISLNDLISETCEMLRVLVGEGVAIVTRLQPDLALVMADSGQMNQVLMNMTVNARDAMPGGGTITVDTYNLTVDEGTAGLPTGAKPGSYVVLSVNDTGIGMSPDTIKKIFEPFFTTKKVGAGTGLGLATAYGIVHQRGGWIRVSSQPGVGTTFRIYLPQTSKPKAEPPIAVAQEEMTDGRETILLVEDQAQVRKLAQAILKRNGYRLLVASNGEEALSLANRHTGLIDILVTDVVMPGITGRELASRLQENRPSLKALYVSGYVTDVIGTNGALDPEMYHLAKPFTAAELVTKVRDVLRATKTRKALLVVDDAAERSLAGS